MEINALKRLLVSGYAWAFIGRMLTAIFGMAVNALLTRILPPDEVGKYFLIVSVVTVLSMVALFGQQRVIVRVVADALAKNLGGAVRNGVRYSFMIVVVMSFLIAIGFNSAGPWLFLALFKSKIIQTSISLAALLLAVRALSSLSAETYRSFHDIRSAVLYNGALVNIFYTAALLTYLFFDKHSLETVLFLSVAVYGLNIFIAWIRFDKLLENVGSNGNVKARELIILGLPFLATSLTLFILTQADIWIVGSTMDDRQVALYGAAAKLVQMTVIPLMIVNAVLPSIVTDLYARGRKKLLEKVLRTSSMVAAVPALIVLVTVIFASNDILAIVFGDYYRGASTALTIISIGQAVNVFAGAGYIVLMMVGFHYYAMLISIASGVVLVVAGLYAGKVYGIDGVATVVSITNAFQALSILILVRVKVGIWSHVGFGSVSALITQFNKITGRSIS